VGASIGNSQSFSYYFPYLLSEAQWIHQNGWLTIPYFTPDYCGGLPWLANPQLDSNHLRNHDHMRRHQA
jgi:hypothetical protein